MESVETQPQRRKRKPWLMSVPEVAKKLGLGKSKVYEMTKRGELPVVRIGTAVRVPRAELEVWIQERTEAQI